MLAELKAWSGADRLENPEPRLENSYTSTRQQLNLTLLFMTLVGVQRTWDLRSYSGDSLGLLTGRERAYGYIHTERYLAQMAQAGAAEPLTDLLAVWTHRLWAIAPDGAYYIDGHKKAVYSDSLLPRSLVGRLGKILGCRALTLLMDAQGHPLLVLTARGDQHLTVGLPAIVERYEEAVGQGNLAQIIVDREGMSAEFLKALSTQRTVITLLRSNQYQGLESFSQVGEFVPLEVDREGTILREVAPAQFMLTLPNPTDPPLPLFVALIRDNEHQVPGPLPAIPVPWYRDLPLDQNWWKGDWTPTPAPNPPTQPKLIPIVSTANTLTPVELVNVYGQRWSAQENIIRDFLLPLGLDINHGYTKTPVENSEIAKPRATLQKRLDNYQRWATNAYRKKVWNRERGDKLWEEAKVYADKNYRVLDLCMLRPKYRRLSRREYRAVYKQKLALIQPEIDRRFAQARHHLRRAEEEGRKYERYCKQQREILRELDVLAAQERTMYELDNAKDQIMSVLKLFLANLMMWTRDRLFPPDYAHATTTRLLPFFRLPGRVLSFNDCVLITLRPFNDRALNRDLADFCQRVNNAHLCLPAGKLLIFKMAESTRLTSDPPP